MKADFFELDVPVEVAAVRLLGCTLWRELDNGEMLAGKIVETEAYDQTDAASHSYKGRTTRTDVMFGSAGRLYVYFTYGMHYCMNIVVGQEGHGAAVLIRAIEPLAGEETMATNRGGKTGVETTNGPAKACQALGINKTLNGHNLHRAPLKLRLEPPIPAAQITQTTRIGITQAVATPWRFYITNNPYVSKK